MGISRNNSANSLHDDKPYTHCVDKTVNLVHEDHSPNQEQVYQDIANKLGKLGDIIDNEYLQRSSQASKHDHSMVEQITASAAKISLMLLQHLK